MNEIVRSAVNFFSQVFKIKTDENGICKEIGLQKINLKSPNIDDVRVLFNANEFKLSELQEKAIQFDKKIGLPNFSLASICRRSGFRVLPLAHDYVVGENVIFF